MCEFVCSGAKTGANQQQNQQNKLRRGQYVQVVCSGATYVVEGHRAKAPEIDIDICWARMQANSTNKKMYT